MDLASEDVPTAYRAVWALRAAPEQALPLLRERLRKTAYALQHSFDLAIRKLVGVYFIRGVCRRRPEKPRVNGTGRIVRCTREASAPRPFPERDWPAGHG